MDVRILPFFEATTSVDHQSREGKEYGDTRGDRNSNRRTEEFAETRSGNAHSTVQKQDDVRRETVKKLIHQFETHPNRESLMADLDKNQKFDPFSDAAWETRSTSRCARSLLKYHAKLA